MGPGKSRKVLVDPDWTRMVQVGPGSSYFFSYFFCLIVAGSSDWSDSCDRSILFGTKTVQHTP